MIPLLSLPPFNGYTLQCLLTFALLRRQLIVAVEQEEVPRLKALYERGLKNNVRDLSIVDAKGIREREPFCRVSASVLR